MFGAQVKPLVNHFNSGSDYHYDTGTLDDKTVVKLLTKMSK